MRLRYWTIALFTFLLLGCSNPNGRGLTVESDFQQVLIGEGDVARNISVKDILSQEVNGHTRAAVVVKNEGSFDLAVQYRFYWYDDYGLEVSAQESPWKRKLLRAGETATLSEVSLSPKGREYRIQLRDE